MIATPYALSAGHSLIFLTVAAGLLLAGALQPRFVVLQRARINFVALGLLVFVALYAIDYYKTSFAIYDLVP